MTNDQTTPEPMATPEWATIGQAADLLEVSAKTIRRRIKAGDLIAEKRHDSSIGGERWFVDLARLPKQPGAGLVPVEILDRLEEAWREVREATADAARATQTAEFERERRIRATDALETTKAENGALRARLDAELARRWWRRGR